MREVFYAILVFLAGAAGARAQSPSSADRSQRLRLPLSRFYDVPNPMPPARPGELIRSETSDQYDVPYDMSALRILYHSRSAQGEDVAVSGVVLFPGGTPPAGGWPIIAWAHDFGGSARACAPSLVRNLNAGPLLTMYVGLGYAIVASDYAGLGTEFPNAALDMRSNALDVIYSVPAARTAVPHLGARWIAAGYGQGGLAVVGVAEAENKMKDRNYLGGMAISGVGDAAELFERLARAASYPMPAILAQGIKSIFPHFQAEEILTPKAMPIYRGIGDICSPPGIPSGEMLKPGSENNRFVKDFFTRNTPGEKPAFSPLFIISGDADPIAPSSLAAGTVARMCKQGDRVLFRKYPELDASAVMGNSVSEQISWIRARFTGRPAPSSCP